MPPVITPRIATPKSPKEARGNPLHRAYRPAGAALELARCGDGEVLIEGPAGTGKSRAALEKLHAAAQKHSGMRGAILRKTRKSLTQSAMVTFEQKVLAPGDGVRWRSTTQEYRYLNGSVLVVGGLDDPQKIMSSEYDLIYVQEATEATEHDWEMLATRLRNGVMPYQQLMADCNPGAPTHWLNQRCNRGATTRLLSRHEDNPSVSEDYLNRLRALSGVRRTRLYEGRWAQTEGTVHQGWNSAPMSSDASSHPWDSPRACRATGRGTGRSTSDSPTRSRGRPGPRTATGDSIYIERYIERRFWLKITPDRF